MTCDRLARRGAVAVVMLATFSVSCRKSSPPTRLATSATLAIDAPAVESRPGDMPSAVALEAYVTGAGNVQLGMTESQVSDALGEKPTRREDAMSPGATTDVAWDDLKGARPGAALGRFRDGRLISIEFASTFPVLPRIDRGAADAVTTPDFVRASVARTLQMTDIEAVTRTRGHRMSWSVMRGADGRTMVLSRWIWEVEPGGEALLVVEYDGLAGQPNIRSRSDGGAHEW
jgi:hypothetical protein